MKRKAHRVYRHAAKIELRRLAIQDENDGDLFVPHAMTDWDVW